MSRRLARPAFGHFAYSMQTLTIKLEREQHAWLQQQAKTRKRSKGSIIRELISHQQMGGTESLGQALADLRGCLKGSKDLSTRFLKGYGRR